MDSTPSPPDTIYGFIGIGVMGYGMAMNLRRKMPPTSKLILCEINQERREEFVREASPNGPIEVAETPMQIAEKAEIIITMLPKAVHVNAVFKDPNTGLLAAEKSGTPIFFLECSSIDTSSSVALAREVLDSGHGRLIDAPVSGGYVVSGISYSYHDANEVPTVLKGAMPEH
jgi:3-hydroxyisobutyrate/3-hydroxypropionate dehydrogenase